MATKSAKPGAGWNRPQTDHGRTEFDPQVVQRIVEGVIGSLEGDLSGAEIKLYRELEDLARYISTAKAEIAALSPDDISQHHIPKATNELDAIIEATEEATNEIMGAAEQIEAVAGELDGAQAERLTQAVTEIYEACGFQDITGQRITKVVKTLKHIDERVAVLVSAFGSELHKAAPAEPVAPAAPGPLTERDVLNGPQLGPDAKTQDEIDALLASMD